MVLTTNEGLLFLAIGNCVGAALALVLFSLTVVSFPLLLERDVDFVTAMITSVRAVVTSPGPMIGWAAAIVLLLAISALPYFLGLVVTLPMLGHATWHLYRRMVAPVAAEMPEKCRRPPAPRCCRCRGPPRASEATDELTRHAVRNMPARHEPALPLWSRASIDAKGLRCRCSSISLSSPPASRWRCCPVRW